jgi:hypothetical protein
MLKTMKFALVALALAGGAMTAAIPAKAEVTVAVDPGGVAFGYEDGYWDRGRAWHTWPSHEAAVQYQTANHDHYYGYKHDRDPDKGWRENDTWWHK